MLSQRLDVDRHWREYTKRCEILQGIPQTLCISRAALDTFFRFQQDLHAFEVEALYCASKVSLGSAPSYVAARADHSLYSQAFGISQLSLAYRSSSGLAPSLSRPLIQKPLSLKMYHLPGEILDQIFTYYEESGDALSSDWSVLTQVSSTPVLCSLFLKLIPIQRAFMLALFPCFSTP